MISQRTKTAAYGEFVRLLEESMRRYSQVLKESEDELATVEPGVGCEDYEEDTGGDTGEEYPGHPYFYTPSSDLIALESIYAKKELIGLRMQEVQSRLLAFQRLSPDHECRAVEEGALVEVLDSDRDEPALYLIANTVPSESKLFRTDDGTEVRIVNPRSAAGQALLGHHAGDKVIVRPLPSPNTLNPNGSYITTIRAIA